MTTSDGLRYTRIHLAHGSGELPAVGFGTLIPDPLATKQATKAALEAGFRHLDCAERYRNEEAVGDAIREAFKAGTLQREDLFVTTKLWNTNHRPERVRSAFDASRRRLKLDYVDCYLIHTPFAFQPGDEQDPSVAGRVLAAGPTAVVIALGGPVQEPDRSPAQLMALGAAWGAFGLLWLVGLGGALRGASARMRHRSPTR